MFSLVYIYDGALIASRNAPFGWCESVAASRQRKHARGPIESRWERKSRKYRHWLRSRLDALALLQHTHTRTYIRSQHTCASLFSRDLSKRLTSIVRRPPCYPIHTAHLAIALWGKSSSNKIQYSPGGAICAGRQLRKGAQSQNLRAPYRRNFWHRRENSFAIEARRLFATQFDEPADRYVAEGTSWEVARTCAYLNHKKNAAEHQYQFPSLRQSLSQRRPPQQYLLFLRIYNFQQVDVYPRFHYTRVLHSLFAHA